MKLFALLFLALLCAAASPSGSRCGPLLNEVMADPAQDWNGDSAYDFKNDEWVELVNPGASDLALDGFFVGDETGAFVYGFAGSLAAGSVKVIFGSDAVAWESANGESTTGLRLGNDGDTVTLWQVSGPDTLLVDAYTYTTYEADDDRSSGRNPDGGSEWQLFDALNPYSGATPPPGNGLPPTPGGLNVGGDTPALTSTWGKIKAIYSAE